MSVDHGFYRYDQFIELPYDADPWLIKPIVPSGAWVNIYGQPKKARKSYLAIGMSWAVASDQPNWLGFDVQKHGPVLYLQVDTPHSIWRQRNVDIAEAGYDLSNVWFASIATMPYPFNIAQHEDELAEMINTVDTAGEGEPVMVIYDTARKMHTLNENDSNEMTQFMAALERVSGLDKTKVLITHDKKGPSEGDTKGKESDDEHEREGGDLMRGNRGSSAVSGAVDTIIKLTPKGYMYYQGRAVGEEHKKLKFTHVGGEMGFMWEEDVNDEVQEARHLISTYKQGSERSLARLMCKKFPGMEEEKARAIIKRQKEHA